MYELECKRKYGPVWGYYTLTQPRVVIHDPEILRQVCIGEFSNFVNRDEEQAFQLNGDEVANGLLSVIDKQWKRTRSTLTPTFSSSKLRQMTGIMNSCIDNTLKVFICKVERENGHFVATNLFRGLALDVMCSAAFSVDVNSQDETNEEPVISKYAKDFLKFGFFDWPTYVALFFPFLEPFLQWRGGRQNHVVYFRQLCGRMIKNRSENTTDRGNRVDLMQLMLDAKISESDLKQSGTEKGLVPIEIIGNAITMLMAGSETTGTSMSYFAYNLAFHPDVQKKLQAEIDEMFNENDALDLDIANRLKYLDMCVKESMRLYPAVARTIRHSKNEITICGLTIPRGWIVAIPIYSMCHDAQFWNQPMEFKPERMANATEIDPIIFQPFGAGPRGCIGSRFALMEMKLAFCKILRHFSFEPTSSTPKPPLEMVFGATTSPKVNFSLCVLPRQ